MRVPKQSPSVDRSVNVAAQVKGSGSVVPSVNWWKVAGKVARGLNAALN